MKMAKKILALALAVMMIMTVLVVPTSAATATAPTATEFASFPELYHGSYENGYIKALQRFLLCYPSTHDYIYTNTGVGGVDGGFGPKTEQAVKAFQASIWGENSSEVDGYVGSKTWTQIRYKLTTNSPYLVSNGSYVVHYTSSSLYTFNQNGAEYSSPFHSR